MTYIIQRAKERDIPGERLYVQVMRVDITPIETNCNCAAPEKFDCEIVWRGIMKCVSARGERM